MTEDRRRHDRRPVRYVQLRSPAAGRVLDLGPSGMQVETQHALAVGSHGQFSIGDEEHCARLRGMVRWCRLLETRSSGRGDVTPVFRAGIVFLGLSGELPEDLAT